MIIKTGLIRVSLLSYLLENSYPVTRPACHVADSLVLYHDIPDGDIPHVIPIARLQAFRLSTGESLFLMLWGPQLNLLLSITPR